MRRCVHALRPLVVVALLSPILIAIGLGVGARRGAADPVEPPALASGSASVLPVASAAEPESSAVVPAEPSTAPVVTAAPAVTVAVTVAPPAPASAAPSTSPSASAEPSSSAAPVVSASASASASASSNGATLTLAAVEGSVRLKDRKIFSVLVDREEQSAVERARRASQALERAFHTMEEGARFERSGPFAVVYVGQAPILELFEDDARAAGAATLEAHAGDVTAKIQAALVEEKRRSGLANTVFSLSLVVFSGLIAFVLLGKSSELGDRASKWLEDEPERIKGLRVGGVEILTPASIEALLTIGIDVGKRIAQLGVLYAWVIFSLSLFEATKGWTDKLTAMVLGPISGFATRVGAALPLAIVAGIAIVATALLVRFVGVFFNGIARGETTIQWVPHDLAAPVGVIVRMGIVVVALVLASPLLTGSDDGALARAAGATLIALGLAATPVLACGFAGAIVVFGRRLRPGEFVEIAGRTGRIRALTLLEVTLEDERGCEVRVPHLLGLLHATRVMGPSPVVVAELVVDPRASQQRVRAVLAEAAAKVGAAPDVDLVSIDVDGALYRVSVAIGPQLVGPMVVATSKRTKSSPLGHPMGDLHRTTSGVTRTPALGEAKHAALGTASTVHLTSLLADALAKEGLELGRRSFASFETEPRRRAR